MSITINKESFFKRDYNIKYLTCYHSEFNALNFTGALQFYNGNPLYIVDVSVPDVENLEESDIIITKGDLHNHSSIDDFIEKNSDIIYEGCKSLKGKSFVLDLKEMRVVERKDFKAQFPTYGMSTFFIFENIIGNSFYSLVNPAKNINDADIFCWFTAYVYSTKICLTPRKEITDYAKKFLQALSGTAIMKGNKKMVRISKSKSVLDGALSDVGEYLLPVPGDTTRFEQLTLKAFEQMNNKKER